MFESDLDVARFRAARFKRARLVYEIAELGLTIGTRIEIRREFSETLAYSTQGNPFDMSNSYRAAVKICLQNRSNRFEVKFRHPSD